MFSICGVRPGDTAPTRLPLLLRERRCLIALLTSAPRADSGSVYDRYYSAPHLRRYLVFEDAVMMVAGRHAQPEHKCARTGWAAILKSLMGGGRVVSRSPVIDAAVRLCPAPCSGPGHPKTRHSDAVLKRSTAKPPQQTESRRSVQWQSRASRLARDCQSCS
jgi:hypothetical protein